MTLLDAILAFALTMAALATIVTILMEIGIRCLGLRRRDQVLLVQKLYDKVIAPRLPEKVTGAVRQWDLVKTVLENPFAKKGKGMAECEKAQGYWGKKSAAIYPEFSLEHFLRRVVDIEEIKTELGKTHAELVKGLAEVGQKYDELRSAISTEFKRKAQFLSVLVGIAVAVVMNVDALRLFQAYLDNPELTERVIDEMETVLKRAEGSQTAIEDAQVMNKGDQDDADEKPGDEAGGARTNGEQVVGEQEDQDDGEQNDNGQAANEQSGQKGGEQRVDALKQAVERLEAQAAFVHDFNLPIGQRYFPHCFAALSPEERNASPDPLCRRPYQFGESFLWFLKALVTGLLIGLGAPFWYDVAKRVAEVRRAFGGRGSAEQRHSGADASESPEARDALIRRVARDALARTDA